MEGLDGSAGAKKKLELFLETVAGKKTVVEAADDLGIGETAFYKFRARWLQESVEILEPRSRGRPRKRPEVVDREEVERLRRENRDLWRALRLGAVKEELAVMMPRVIVEEEKKTRQLRRGK